MWIYLYKYLLSLSVRGVILKRKVLPVCMWEGPTFEVNDLMMKNVSENNFWNLVLHCFLHSNVPLKKKEILTSQLLLHDGLRISFFFSIRHGEDEKHSKFGWMLLADDILKIKIHFKVTNLSQYFFNQIFLIIR